MGGRVSGKHCCEYMLGADVKATSLFDLSGGGLSGAVESSKLSGGSYEDTMNKGKGGEKAAKPAKEKKEKKEKSGGGGGGMTMAEVAKHTTKTDCWVVVSNQVLNVTKFLGEHPGGELAILTFAGKDATEEFNMIHPPDVIGKYAPDAVLGPVESGGEDDETTASGGGGGAPAAKKPFENSAILVLAELAVGAACALGIGYMMAV